MHTWRLWRSSTDWRFAPMMVISRDSKVCVGSTRWPGRAGGDGVRDQRSKIDESEAIRAADMEVRSQKTRKSEWQRAAGTDGRQDSGDERAVFPGAIGPRKLADRHPAQARMIPVHRPIHQPDTHAGC